MDKLDDFIEDIDALCRQYWGEKYKIGNLSKSKRPRIIIFYYNKTNK